MRMLLFIILQVLVLGRSDANFPHNSTRVVHNTPRTFNVMDFGAKGIITEDGSKAMSSTWKAACAHTGPATILVPTGMTMMLNTTEFNGKGCRFSSVHFQIEGQIVAPQTPNWAKCKPQWMLFVNINDLVIDGNGLIDGNGDTYWSTFSEKNTISDGGDNDDGNYGNGCKKAPAAMEIDNCNSVNLHNVNSKNSPGIHIHIKGSTDVHISNVSIAAPAESPNTDGINVRRLQRVTIKDSIIGTGDDCIAINDGSKFLNISNIACGPGHGISVGSLGKDGRTETVEDVYIKNCSFTGTTNGARIKTWTGGSGYARRITYDGITLNNAKNPIFIDQSYDPNITGAVNISDVSFINFNGTSASEEAIRLICSGGESCTNIITNNIHIYTTNSRKPAKAVCKNAHGTQTDTSPLIPCLTPA